MPKKKNKEKFDLISKACAQLDSSETIKNGGDPGSIPY